MKNIFISSSSITFNVSNKNLGFNPTAMVLSLLLVISTDSFISPKLDLIERFNSSLIRKIKGLLSDFFTNKNWIYQQHLEKVIY